jgi:hypothetical protein
MLWILVSKSTRRVLGLTHPGKVSRTSLIYHLGLEGLGEIALDNELGEHVSDWHTELTLGTRGYHHGLRLVPRAWPVPDTHS